MWRNLISNRVPEALHLIELFILGSSTWPALHRRPLFEKIEYCPKQRTRFSIGRQNPHRFILFWVILPSCNRLGFKRDDILSYLDCWLEYRHCLVFLNFIFNLFEYPKRGIFLSKRVRTSNFRYWVYFLGYLKFIHP